MSRSLRVLELAKKLNRNTDDVISVCVLLGIQANSRISCLSNEQVKKLIAYYKKTPQT